MKKEKANKNKSDLQKHKELIESEVIKITAIPVNMLVKPKMIHLKIKTVGIT